MYGLLRKSFRNFRGSEFELCRRKARVTINYRSKRICKAPKMQESECDNFGDAKDSFDNARSRLKVIEVGVAAVEFGKAGARGDWNSAAPFRACPSQLAFSKTAICQPVVNHVDPVESRETKNRFSFSAGILLSRKLHQY